MTPHFYLRFQNVTTRSLFCVKTTEKILSDFVKSRKMYFFIFEEVAGKIFFLSLNIGNISSYKTNAVEIKKKKSIL